MRIVKKNSTQKIGSLFFLLLTTLTMATNQRNNDNSDKNKVLLTQSQLLLHQLYEEFMGGKWTENSKNCGHLFEKVLKTECQMEEPKKGETEFETEKVGQADGQLPTQICDTQNNAKIATTTNEDKIANLLLHVSTQLNVPKMLRQLKEAETTVTVLHVDGEYGRLADILSRATRCSSSMQLRTYAEAVHVLHQIHQKMGPGSAKNTFAKVMLKRNATASLDDQQVQSQRHTVAILPSELLGLLMASWANIWRESNLLRTQKQGQETGPAAVAIGHRRRRRQQNWRRYFDLSSDLALFIQMLAICYVVTLVAKMVGAINNNPFALFAAAMALYYVLHGRVRHRNNEQNNYNRELRHTEAVLRMLNDAMMKRNDATAAAMEEEEEEGESVAGTSGTAGVGARDSDLYPPKIVNNDNNTRRSRIWHQQEEGIMPIRGTREKDGTSAYSKTVPPKNRTMRKQCHLFDGSSSANICSSSTSTSNGHNEQQQQETSENEYLPFL